MCFRIVEKLNSFIAYKFHWLDKNKMKAGVDICWKIARSFDLQICIKNLCQHVQPLVTLVNSVFLTWLGNDYQMWEVVLRSRWTPRIPLKSNRCHGFDWHGDLFVVQSLQHMNLQTDITLEPDDNLFIIHAPLVIWLLHIFTNVFRDIIRLQMRCPFQLHFWEKKSCLENFLTVLGKEWKEEILEKVKEVFSGGFLGYFSSWWLI